MRPEAAGWRTGKLLQGAWREEAIGERLWLWEGAFDTAEPLLVQWEIPLSGIVGKWHSGSGLDRSLTANWTGWMESYATREAPVFCLFGGDSRNRLTFALADAVSPSRMQAQVDEESGSVRCRVVVGEDPRAPVRKELTLRLDLRDVDYSIALADTAQWWAEMPSYQPAPVPAAAREPVYSTWYAFHQELDDKQIEDECAPASSLGFGSVIVDDGWQCDDENKGYDYCGDWEIAPRKFPDFPAHVRRVQALGLHYLLWFSAPFAGAQSRALQMFPDRVLKKPRRNADCLDPRFPGVRNHLWKCWERAISEWGIDGIKLDFVDEFTAEAPVHSEAEDADFTSVPVAADALLSGMIGRLRALRPEVLIEFRQKYTGPAMRKYGNMLRAADCPGDALSNRVRTLDLRLLAGQTPVHSDMVLWHPEESPAGVALQLWATLFSVPQISVRLGQLLPDQRRALSFYLDFWKQQRNLLLHGTLEPACPHLLYPFVRVGDGNTTLVAVYSDSCIPVFSGTEQTAFVVNGSCSDHLTLDLKDLCAEMQGWNCLGEPLPVSRLPPGGPAVVSLPAGGVLRLLRQGRPAIALQRTTFLLTD